MTKAINTEKSAALFERASRCLVNGVSSGMRRHATPVPMYFTHGEGAYFYDVDGNELLDYTLGWGPLIAGNNHPAITAAVESQLKKAYAFGAQHELEIELAEKLVSVLPGVDQVIFSNTGTEAVQAAIRVARTYSGRNKILKFEGHYHGWFNNVLVSYRPKSTDPVKPLPTCGGQPETEFLETLVLPWNDSDAIEKAFQAFPNQIAAVITEPILANSGSCLPKPGYLESIIKLCRENGAVSIFDEVITGFRIALGGAREYYGVTSDLSVYGKALAGGFALSAVGGSREVFDVLRNGKTIHAGTYNGNPINLAAALATVNLLSEPGQFDRLHEHGIAIRACMEDSAHELGIPVVTTGTGSIFSLHFGLESVPLDYREVLEADAAALAIFRNALLDEGILVLPDGRWYVGLAHSERELEKVLPAVRKAMQRVKSRPASAV